MTVEALIKTLIYRLIINFDVLATIYFAAAFYKCQDQESPLIQSLYFQPCFDFKNFTRNTPFLGNSEC